MDHRKMGGMNIPGVKNDGMTASMADGELSKIDIEAMKITLRHGDIKNLDMPVMTMVVVVRDKAMIRKLKIGAKVKFKAFNEEGKPAVTDIQPAG